jgi:hypothetical protein
MRCAINPAVGDERFIHFGPAESKLNVAVVGGGPGGMEAARIATLRGHKVSIFEKSEELGGAILYCCTVHGKNKMRWYADWQRRQIAKLGVEVKYKSVPAPEELKKFDVVLGYGRLGETARHPGIDSSRVCTFEDVLRCKMKNCEYWPKGGKAEPATVGDSVLVWGDYYGAADAVERLALEGKKVYVVTPNKEFAPWMEPCTRTSWWFRGGQWEALTQDLRPSGKASRLVLRSRGRRVIIVDGSFERSVLKVDNVVLADVVADDALFQKYAAAGLTVARIGDVKKVRNLRGAVTDGANLGLALDKDLRLNANLAVIADLPTDIRL